MIVESPDNLDEGATVPVPIPAGFPKLPPGTPMWVYFAFIMGPMLLGGGVSFFGVTFTSATDVNNKLEEHLDDFDDLQYNILLLCEANGIKCKGIDD